MFFISLYLFRACACTFPGEKPPAAVLQSVLQRGQQQLLHWRSHSGGFAGLMLRRTRFCFWCYSQLILTMSKLFFPCTSLSECLVHCGPDSADFLIDHVSVYNIKQSYAFFGGTRPEDCKRKTLQLITRGVQRNSQCWSPDHQCLSPSLLVVYNQTVINTKNFKFFILSWRLKRSKSSACE